MFEFKTISQNDRRFSNARSSSTARPRQQQRLMATALTLLVIALGSVLYHDRDFWFPEEPQVEGPLQSSLASASTSTVLHKHTSTNSHKKSKPQPPSLRAVDPSPDPGPAITATRTVLPPLEVEVIAGNSRRTVHPGSNSVQINLERGSAPAIAVPSAPAEPEATAATMTSKASERVDVSSDAAALVTHAVTPGYPMLARQMKVQGSVILQAMISRDGLIEDLHVVSGPPILAGAAQEAVKQWHFRPHFQGVEPVETQAKITVNFTISTN